MRNYQVKKVKIIIAIVISCIILVIAYLFFYRTIDLSGRVLSAGYTEDTWIEDKNGFFWSDRNGEVKDGWVCVDRFPKQYYVTSQGRIQNKKQEIDGITYTFDEIGNVVIEEMPGTWETVGNRKKYKLLSGKYAKSTWLLIENEWYYFNKEGLTLTNSIIRQNNRRIFVGEQGSLVKDKMFRRGLFRYYADETGVIFDRYNFIYQDQDYIVNKWGHVSRASGIICTTYEEPFIYKDGKNYKRENVDYYYKDMYQQAGKIETIVYELPRQENEGYRLSTGSVIYKKIGEEDDYYYVHDIKTNGFFRYIPS